MSPRAAAQPIRLPTLSQKICESTQAARLRSRIGEPVDERASASSKESLLPPRASVKLRYSLILT